jgi:hypothetical protein
MNEYDYSGFDQSPRRKLRTRIATLVAILAIGGGALTWSQFANARDSAPKPCASSSHRERKAGDARNGRYDVFTGREEGHTERREGLRQLDREERFASIAG